MVRFVAILGLSILIAACSSPVQENTLPSSPALSADTGKLVVPAPPLPAAGNASQAKTTATIRIKIPKRRENRGAKYVSPSTKSIAMTFTPSSHGTAIHVNASLTAADPRCTGSPLVCTLALPLPPKSYLGDFITYDGVLDSHGNPTGSILSKNFAVPLTILKGKNNVLAVTLGGIPAYAVFSATGSALVPFGSDYIAPKCFAPGQPVSVIGQDIDHNMILGPGAPTPTLTSDDTTHLAVATPAPAAPNTFFLSRPAIANAQSVVHLTAKAQAAANIGGAAAASTITVTFNSDICGVFTEWTSGASPQFIVAGPDGALWFTAADQIQRITTAGTISSYSLAASTGPFGITVGPDDALWFTEATANKIGRITTGGIVTNEFTIPTSASEPGQIVTGSDGNLWFTEQCTGKVARVTTGGMFHEYLSFSSSTLPLGITSGPDGGLWFVENAGNRVDQIPTNGGSIGGFPIPTASSKPEGIVTGPDQALWFTECGGNKIGRLDGTSHLITEFPVPTSSSQPQFIATGPDGALWFTEEKSNKIGRVTTAGAFTEFSVPTAPAEPDGIVAGPDGAIWFTETESGKVARLQ